MTIRKGLKFIFINTLPVSSFWVCSLAHDGPRWRSRYSDSLRAGRSADRIPVGARFSVPVQTGPWAYPASCTMGTGSFPGVNRPGGWCWPPTPSKCRGHERVGLYLYSPSAPSWPVIGRTSQPLAHTSTFPATVKKKVNNFFIKS